MGIRRDARERVIQYLFQYDINPSGEISKALEYLWATQRDAAISASEGKSTWGEPVELPPPTSDEVATALFAEPLIHGVLTHRDKIDQLIISYADNWDLSRMAVVDRNILRLAAYEMIHREDIPPIVSINEAVDIAKKYSTEDSGKFVNGILDKICTGLSRSARAATT